MTAATGKELEMMAERYEKMERELAETQECEIDELMNCGMKPLLEILPLMVGDSSWVTEGSGQQTECDCSRVIAKGGAVETLSEYRKYDDASTHVPPRADPDE